MGRRRRATGDAQEAFSRYARHVYPYLHRPGVIKAIKRQNNKRERQEAKKDLSHDN